MIRNSQKLSRRFTLGITLMAVSIFVLAFGIMYVESRKLIHQEVTECLSNMLNTSQLRVRNYMNTIETATISNAWMMEENFTPEALERISNRMVQKNASVISSSVFAVPEMVKEYNSGFSLYTVEQGDTVVTHRNTDYDYLNNVCYSNTVSSGNACWIDPLVTSSQQAAGHQNAIATYCRPLRMKNGRIIGVVATDFSFYHLAKMLNDTDQPFPNAYYMMLGADGRYLIHPDSTRLFGNTIFTDKDPSTDKDMITLGYEMTAARQGTMHISIGGKVYHVCYKPVEGSNWSLALVCPDYDAMEYYHNLSYGIIILLVIGLIIVLLLSHKEVRLMVSPMSKLIDVTKKITNGQYDEPIPVARERGLAYKLQNTLSVMQKSIKERMGSLQKNAEEIREHNDRLEQAKQQAEDAVRRKNLFIEHATQQMRMPLNVITGFADVLGQSCTDKDMVSEKELSSITEMMKDNYVSMNRMALMLNDATETDVKGTLSCRRENEISCNKLAKECIDYTLGLAPEANIQFETELKDSELILTCDIYLRNILCELLYNAVKGSDGKNVGLQISQTKNNVCFTVHDAGPGLPDNLPDIDPFTITDNLSEATGIGLVLAKRHATALGGNLSIDTDYHDGCRITVEMPK